ncbi:type IV pilus biogenesis protein PilM [Desulforamulus hydrothermalis]|uniref:type IV pilus biogenesis protein PilM n=1 Tax=Desulforamulus hydrothermalis TaxID=412895 RepID=UPI0009207ABD|nr:type IV pilus assembly protein PilM [Desulforamulus hydrothermalis]SHG73894.1 type IV pilus assembly protein PilM [Desulforamulus hydrothermalis Lam5 = DSM 18033]
MEIDTGVIRVVELQGSGRSAFLAAAGQTDIPLPAVSEGVVAQAAAVAGALRELWARCGISKQHVVLGICNQNVFMRIATLPKIPEKKLAQALRFQAGQYFPVNLSQLVFDYALLGEVNKANAAELEVLLVASRRDIVQSNLQALQAAGLQTEILDISYLALLRTLSAAQRSDTLVLVDIANGLTTIQLVSQGVPRFSRVIAHSLITYADEAGLALQEAALLSRPPAGDWLVTLANEIRSSVSYYLAQGNASTVNSVLLSGRGARLKQLPERLQEELEVPVTVLDPLQNLSRSLPATGVHLGEAGADFAVCIGLALRGLGA